MSQTKAAQNTAQNFEDLTKLLDRLEKTVSHKKQILSGSQQDLFGSLRSASKQTGNDNLRPVEEGGVVLSKLEAEQLGKCLDNAIDHLEAFLAETEVDAQEDFPFDTSGVAKEAGVQRHG